MSRPKDMSGALTNNGRYIGLGLAITSSMAIGTSFIITKLGLIDTCDKDGFEGDGFSYLKNPIWWAGMVTSRSLSVAVFHRTMLTGNSDCR